MDYFFDVVTKFLVLRKVFTNFFCFIEKKDHVFGTSRGCINNDRFIIFILSELLHSIKGAGGKAANVSEYCKIFNGYGQI